MVINSKTLRYEITEYVLEKLARHMPNLKKTYTFLSFIALYSNNGMQSFLTRLSGVPHIVEEN